MIVHVSFYRTHRVLGSKRRAYEIVAVDCSNGKNCSYRDKGQCLAIRKLTDEPYMIRSCKFAKHKFSRFAVNDKGYREFWMKWKNHPKTNALKYAPHRLGIVGDYLALPYRHLVIRKVGKRYVCRNRNDVIIKTSFVPLNKFTPDLARRIALFKPSRQSNPALMKLGGLHLFVKHLREEAPDLYEFSSRYYPEIFKKINYEQNKASKT